MKDKAPVIGLIIVVIGLGIALIVVSNKAKQERDQAEDNIKMLSNNWTSVRSSLDEQQAVNRTLETNLATTTTEYSNKLAERDAKITATLAELDKTKSDAKAQADAAAAAIAEKDKKITSLENQNQELDKQSVDMHASISNLETRIAETQQKLATSEGDRTALLKELKDLQAKKDELERKFNDLASLKEQVHKLKEELSIARRLDWIRRGIYETLDEKGAQRMMHPVYPVPPAANPTLNVELKQSGGVKVQAPAPGTNH
jgi:chromosome segregation ATPase